jgi:ketosteroid isomerase-like protein
LREDRLGREAVVHESGSRPFGGIVSGPMSEENVELVRRMLDAFNSGDVEAVVAAFDEACLVEEPREMPDRPAEGFRGHDGIREWMANLHGVGEISFEPTSMTSSRDLVLMELNSRGRGEASGAPFEWTTFAVVHVGGGKITRVQAFLGRDDALKAAGLSD